MSHLRTLFVNLTNTNHPHLYPHLYYFLVVLSQH